MSTGGSGEGRGGGRRGHEAVLALALVLLVVILSSFALPPAGASNAQPSYSPPPREVSPFTSSDAFCTRNQNAFPGVKPNDPRLAVPISAVMLAPPVAPGASLPSGAHLGDPIDEARTFAGLIDKCGGIGGRKLDLHVVVETGNPLVDCAAATQAFHAVVVMTWTRTAAASCIVRQARTVLITNSDVSNAELKGTQGRLAATGSSEGSLQAKLVALVDSGRLDGKHVAIDVPAGDADGEDFARTATAVLTADKIPIVLRPRANVVLTPALDPRNLGSSQLLHPPIDVYGFSDTSDLPIDAVRTGGVVPVSSLDSTTGLYSWTSIADAQGLTGAADGAFATMCNREYDANHGRGVATVDLPAPPPVGTDAPYVQVARVCLVMRILARSFYNAGVDDSQPAVVAALHRLPYIENTLPDGAPIARPNQVVNEPVARVAQTVVLSRAQYPCEHPSSSTTTSVLTTVCWGSVWGAGHAVNAPLLGRSRAPATPTHAHRQTTGP